MSALAGSHDKECIRASEHLQDIEHNFIMWGTEIFPFSHVNPVLMNRMSYFHFIKKCVY